MHKLGRGALQAMRIFMVTCLALMVLLVFGNVVLRYGFNSGISVSEEVSRYLFVWLTFIGSVLAMQEHSHLGVDTLVSRLPLGGKKFCAIASDVLMLGCCALLLIGSWKQAGLNMDNAAPVSGMPIAVMYAAGVAASVGLLIVITLHLWRVASGRADADELVQVAESEEPMPEVAIHGARS